MGLLEYGWLRAAAASDSWPPDRPEPQQSQKATGTVSVTSHRWLITEVSLLSLST